MPRTKGIRLNTLPQAPPLYSSTLMAISPSVFRTATLYFSRFLIMTPSSTACPPIPEYLVILFIPHLSP